MSAKLSVGLSRSQTLRVDAGLTVPHVSASFAGFADMPPVLATAFLVGFVEWVCVEALHPCLAPGEQTVGVHVDLSHVAPTPVGMDVTAHVELVEIRGCRLRFKVSCRDKVDLVSEGYHERCIVKRPRFDERVAAKAGDRG
jgi:fluoroacetyl-CoA thioesterase